VCLCVFVSMVSMCVCLCMLYMCARSGAAVQAGCDLKICILDLHQNLSLAPRGNKVR